MKSNEMKLISIIILAIILFPKISFSQSSSLDGKSFGVTMYLQKKKDSLDTLTFQNNSLIFATAKKYGFIAESMKPKEKNGNIHFVATYKSKKNGTMIWEGTVMNDSIAGTLIWDTTVRNPDNYTFTGKEIKNP